MNFSGYLVRLSNVVFWGLFGDIMSSWDSVWFCYFRVLLVGEGVGWVEVGFWFRGYKCWGFKFF